MADSQDERKRITAELALKRAQLSVESRVVHQNLDFSRRLSDSIRSHSWNWMSVAAIFGWLLSRLPARKKKIYIHTAGSEKKRQPSGGFAFQVWKGVWSMAKPLVVAYLTKKIAEKAKIPGAKWL